MIGKWQPDCMLHVVSVLSQVILPVYPGIQFPWKWDTGYSCNVHAWIHSSHAVITQKKMKRTTFTSSLPRVNSHHAATIDESMRAKLWKLQSMHTQWLGGKNLMNYFHHSANCSNVMINHAHFYSGMQKWKWITCMEMDSMYIWKCWLPHYYYFK